ncbi:CopG family transcriptional regulator [Methanocella sp. CWC-04]|uniref:CopG family transcriptional regulator n=1 Tax=Methanooceanicella nereidis TaxID=2052831 RepID=A0AAP2RG09_9EURY|nr:ribbon-helix-helix protein, CopG family [Methanocella sp. CWC-04]MCD1295547.1 CopG family transcriptional regulator [Methanocella sp. CWC-04]
MKSPIRVTISFDERTYQYFEDLKDEQQVSQSELIRRAVRFYYDNRAIDKDDRIKVNQYVNLLGEGEHVILDVDHWMLFLNLVDNLADNDTFWKTHKEIAQSHAEQFSKKSMTPEEIMKRLETCNFYKISRSNGSDHEYTLLTGPGSQRRFIKEFLEETFDGIGVKADIKEDYSKLRVILEKEDKPVIIK